MPVPTALTESESCLTTAFAELGLGLRCRPPLYAGSSKRCRARPEASGATVRGFFYLFKVLIPHE
jgi:hypothetical protein